MLTTPSTGRAVLGILRGRTTPPPALEQRAQLGAFSLASGTRQAGPTVVLGHDAHDYSVSAAAYRAAEYVASNLASVDLTVAGPDGSANDTHPVARLWNQGTTGAPFSARTTRHVMFSRAELSGESMAYIDRGPTGTGVAAGLYPLFDPVEVHIRQVLDANGRPTGREELVGFVVLVGRITGGVQARVPLLPSEVLWLRYPHPFKPWESLAPWRAALHAVESDHWARAWQLGEFKNGARPSHVIDLGSVSDEVDARARAEYRSEIEGPGNAGKALIISASEDAMGDTGRAPSVHRLSLTPAEMSYLESRTANSTEVFLAFGLRTDLFMGQATYENQRAAKIAAWSDRLLPALDVLGSELDRQLLPSTTEQAAWDLSQIEALRENADAIAARVRQLAPTDTMLIDELREQMGYGPLPGGLGQLTFTAYRNALSVETAKALAAAGVGQPSTTSDRGRVLRLAVRGRTITHRPTRAMAALPAAQTRAGLSVKRTLALYDRHERAGVKAVKRLAARQEKAVLRELRKVMRLHVGDTLVRVRAADVFDQTYWAGETALAMEPFLEAVWGEGGQRTADALGVDYDDPMTARVLEAMATRRDVLADKVTATTRSVLESQLLQGAVEQGESVDQIADRIRAVFTTLSSSRAETIARTEVVGGYNAASHTVAMAEGGPATRKVWLATDDDDTRKTHRDLDGDEVPLTQPFRNGLMFPGDPSGKPTETIRCRCVLLYEE